MSTKTVAVRQGLRGIKTKNGKSTFTATIYDLPLKTYTPLPNGFNLELAEEVFKIIENTQLLWDQDSWRNPVWMDPGAPEYDEIVEKIEAITADMKKPVCGATMCFAGWATECSRMDWVIDGGWFKLVNEQGTQLPQRVAINQYIDQVLIKQDDPVYADLIECCGPDDGPPTLFEDMPAPLVTNLKKRGFSELTHASFSAGAVAKRLLGIGDDKLGLFQASNDLEEIRRIIDFYAARGGRLSQADVRDYIHGDY